MAWSTPSTQITGDLMTAAIWNQNVVYNTIALTAAGFVWLFDGGGAAYTVDDPVPLEAPFKCDIDRVTMIHDQPSTTTISIWKDTYANVPPTAADDISNGGISTSAVIKAQDSTLSGWSPAIG